MVCDDDRSDGAPNKAWSCSALRESSEVFFGRFSAKRIFGSFVGGVFFGLVSFFLEIFAAKTADETTKQCFNEVRTKLAS